MPPYFYPPCVLRKTADIYTLVPSSHLERKIDIENSVYSISNYMRQIQRLFDSNILRDWNEDIISIQKR